MEVFEYSHIPRTPSNKDHTITSVVVFVGKNANALAEPLLLLAARISACRNWKGETL